jgi:putative Mg2+ transporter-C (MgtC) family protein
MNPAVAFDAQNVRDVVVNLVIAAILGGVIGAQRQAAHKPAGFRTHLLVALGSCAFMEASRFSGDTRIGANIITGIGFLGAGSIVREGITPRGLTTAASIWAVSAIGLALAFDTPMAYVLAIATTVLVFLSLSITDRRLDKAFPPKNELELALTFDLEALTLEAVERLFADAGIRIKHSNVLDVANDAGHRIATWRVTLHAHHGARVRAAIVAIAAAAGVHEIKSLPLAES